MWKKLKVSSVEQSFKNIGYGSYPWNADLNELSIEYEQILFTKQPKDRLTNNITERLKVSSIRRWFDNRIYKMNHQNTYLDELPFDGD